jgi:hypothetical protein
MNGKIVVQLPQYKIFTKIHSVISELFHEYMNRRKDAEKIDWRSAVTRMRWKILYK